MNCLYNAFMQVILHKTQCNRMSLNFFDRKFHNRNSRLRSPQRKPLHFPVRNAQHHKVLNHLSNTGLINSATYNTNINLRIPNSCHKKAVSCIETPQYQRHTIPFRRLMQVFTNTFNNLHTSKTCNCVEANNHISCNLHIYVYKALSILLASQLECSY